MFAKIKHNDSGDYVYFSIDLVGSSGITILKDGTTLGVASENPMLSGTIDSLDVMVSGTNKEPRKQTLALLIEGGTAPSAQQAFDALATICQKITRSNGGTLFWRATGSTYVSRFEISYAQLEVTDLSDYDAFGRLRCNLNMIVDPYPKSDPYDITDKFDTDTTADGNFNFLGSDWTSRNTYNGMVVQNGVARIAPNYATYVAALAPAGWWRMSDTVGSATAADSSGAGRTGTVNGNPVFGAAGAILGETTNTCLDLDGTGDYVSVPFAAALNPAATFLFSAWIYRDVDTGGVEYICDSRNATSLLGYALRINAADKLELVVADGAASSVCCTGGTSLLTGQWYHVAMHFTGGNGVLYLNGTNDSAIAADVYSPNLTAPLIIGASNATNLFLNGKIDEVTLFTSALSLVTSSAIYFAGIDTTATRAGDLGRRRFIHTGNKNTYANAQVSAKFSVYHDGSTIIVGSGFRGGIILKEYDANNYIECVIDDVGAGGRITINKVLAGVETAVAGPTVFGTALSATTYFWLSARMEGHKITFDFWNTLPTPSGAATQTATYTLLPGTEQNLFGTDQKGATGFTISAMHPFTTVDDFKVRAFTNRLRTFPDVVTLHGATNGKVDALMSAQYTNQSGGTAPRWIMFSWWPRSINHNILWNGDAEVVGNVAATAYGWSIAAVAGVITNPATSFLTSASTTAHSGSKLFTLINPAVANTGTNFLLYGPDDGMFRAGETYIFSGFLRFSAGVQPVDLLLGVSGNVATGTAVTPNSDPRWQAISVTWVPTADTPIAYAAIRVAGAGGQTTQFDDMVCYKNVGVIGQTPIPPTFTQGGYGLGIIPASSFDQAKASIATDGTYWTIAADATYRNGYRVRGAGAMGITANLEYFVLPHLFAQDDFTSGEIDLAVIIRAEVPSTMTGLKCIVSLAPETGVTYGRRYTNFRDVGKTMRLPSGGTVFKPYHLGMVTARVDINNPTRWKLRLAFSSTGVAGNFGVDYIALVPSQNILSSRRGALDALVPSFISSTAETTKLVDSSGSVQTINPAVSDSAFQDDSLGGRRMMIKAAKVSEVLVLPSDQVIDLADSSTHNMAKSHVGSVQFPIQPQTHFLNQG